MPTELRELDIVLIWLLELRTLLVVGTAAVKKTKGPERVLAALDWSKWIM